MIWENTAELIRQYILKENQIHGITSQLIHTVGNMYLIRD